MYVFFDTLIEPLLDTLRPRTLVEIGSDDGDNTRRLLEFCERHDARLHVIDPVPKYDVAAWEERYGERFVFHRALSLEALPAIEEGFDVVLVDGDHNWYTVYNELRVVEGRCRELGLPFPVVMLHDVGWPYGRRDGYYDPSNIPEEHLREHRRQGIEPGNAGLLESGGYNVEIANATVEGGPRNGVLTAVEDFVAASEEGLALLRLPGLHGFAMLYRGALADENAEFGRLVRALTLSPEAERYVESVEARRLESELRREGAERRRRASERRRKEQAERIEDLKGQLDEIKNSRSWRMVERIGRLRTGGGR